MPVRGDDSILIEGRPPAEVFPFLSDPERRALWQSNLVEAAPLTDGPIGKGSRLREVWRVIGRRMEAVVEVTEHEEPHIIAFRGVEAPVDFEESYRCEERDGGTLVGWKGEATLKGFFGKFPDAVAVRLYLRDVRSNLEKLKVLLEAEAI